MVVLEWRKLVIIGSPAGGRSVFALSLKGVRRSIYVSEKQRF